MSTIVDLIWWNGGLGHNVHHCRPYLVEWWPRPQCPPLLMGMGWNGGPAPRPTNVDLIGWVTWAVDLVSLGTRTPGRIGQRGAKRVMWGGVGEEANVGWSGLCFRLCYIR